MKHCIPVLILCLISFWSSAQNTDDLTASFHQDRRKALRSLMPEKSIAFIFAAPIRNRSNDVDFQYSQNPDFYYLTGYKEPDALLVLFKEEKNIQGKTTNEILFVRESNPKEEIWTGKRLGLSGARNTLGVTTCFLAADFKDFEFNFKEIDKMLVQWPDLPNHDKSDPADLSDLVDQLKEKLSKEDDKTDTYRINKYLAQLRQIKTNDEIQLIQKAIDVSIEGFKDVFSRVHAGMYEYQIQAIAEYHMKMNGAEFQGYESICGSGGNSCILHYEENRKQLKDGEVMLCDMGAEYHGYSADITRTFPVNGTFTTEQAAIYNLVLKAQDAGIKACIAGNHFTATQNATSEIIAQGLKDLGIIKDKADYTDYFMHGTSHYLGLDVHDAGTYGALEPGMVITVEPGIYIPEGSLCDSKWWNIGVRIEDDIMITVAGPVNMSGKLPRTIPEIYAAMHTIK